MLTVPRFRGLYIVLDDVGQRLPGLKLDEAQSTQLASLTEAFQAVLDDTNDVLEKSARLGVKSSSLGTMARRALKKVTWDDENIRDLRGRIISNTTLLNTFITSLTRSVAYSNQGLHEHWLTAYSMTAQLTDDKVTALVGRVQDVRLQNEGQERRKILDSISAMDFAAQQSAILDQRQGGTGQWLLDSEEFQAWVVKNKGRTLLCTGMPGAGK